jgi:hypothetical protein
MKRLIKVILVAIPALVVAAAVGTTTIGCGDDTSVAPPVDMAVTTIRDMALGRDMRKAGD